jgi:hypothetical protein
MEVYPHISETRSLTRSVGAVLSPQAPERLHPASSCCRWHQVSWACDQMVPPVFTAVFPLAVSPSLTRTFVIELLGSILVQEHAVLRLLRPYKDLYPREGLIHRFQRHIFWETSTQSLQPLSPSSHGIGGWSHNERSPHLHRAGGEVMWGSLAWEDQVGSR